MGLRLEIWTRPGDANFGRVIDDLPSPAFTFHDGMNLTGDGTARVASAFDRFDEILVTNEATPANSVASLARLFSDGSTIPVAEWLPNLILPTTDKADPNVDISGAGMKSILDWARVEAYDWDGSDEWVPKIADWLYGGPNALSNPSFEENQITPKAFEIVITATGGTFTLSDGTDTTAAIAWNASASTIETRIETDLGKITDIIVSDAGPGVTVMELVTPAFGVNLSLNAGSLTGGTGSITTTREGGEDPSPWTRAMALVTGVPKDIGNYDAFRLSTVSHSGSQSLLVDPGPVGATANRGAGAQQVVGVTPGGIYQASVWIRPVSATDEFIFGLFSVGEELIASTTFAGTSFPANTWSQMTLTDVQIPDNVSRIIFRVFSANKFPSDPDTFYIDDAELNEGLVATTVGTVLGDLYDDATSDHSAVRLVWEDEANPGTAYLTLDFTDSVDSNGDPWAHSGLTVKLWMRMTYRQVMDQFATSYGYEWRIVPDSVENGTWLWQVYNPGGMQTDYSTAATPAIQGGASDTRRSIRRYKPSATNHLVEGLGRITARRDTAGLETAIGRIEGQRLDRELPDADSVYDGATEDAVDVTRDANVYSYELVDPADEPLRSYGIGDVLIIHDPPEVEDTGRLIDVELVATPSGVTYETQFVPTTAQGS